MYLFLMRGTTCSGKSTLVGNLGLSSTCLSSDKFRELLTGDAEAQHANKLVFETLRNVMKSRMNERAIVTIDATNLKFADAAEYFEEASKWGYTTIVVNLEPLPLDVLIQRSKERADDTGFSVPEAAIVKHVERYNNCTPHFKQALEAFKNVYWVDIAPTDSEMEVTNKVFSYLEKRPPLQRLDVDSNVFELYAIGDVHGCLSELYKLMDKCALDAELQNKEPRFILLGDLIDRGPHSFESLMMAKNEAVIGSVLGNHEWLFIQEMNGKECRSMSRKITHEKYQALTPKAQQDVFDVITSMPAVMYISYDGKDFALSHSPLADMFAPGEQRMYKNFRSHSMTRNTPDIEKMKNCDEYHDPIIHIHGHQSWQYVDIHEQMQTQAHIKSKQLNIDSCCVYGGVLTALRLRDLQPIQVQSTVNVEKENFGTKQ